MSDSRIDDFVAVIPAGGVGSRLWPLSTPEHPKFLIDLLGAGATLIQDTYARLEPMSGGCLVVTGAAHAATVGEQLPELGEESILAEPSPRDSMAAIALAAAVIEQRQGPAVMGSFAADHVIPEPAEFRAAVATAVAAARTGRIVTIGIEPTSPSTAFGYIQAAGGLEGVEGAREVAQFTEKPDAETAARMIADGAHFWNAGMFVMRTDVLLGHLARLQPGIHDGVREIAAAWDTAGRADVVAKVWPTLTKIAIDHAIAEPVAAQGGVAVVPASFAWDDVGDFASLAEMVPGDAEGRVSISRSAPLGTVESPGAVAIGGSLPVVVVGIEDAVVVQTDDAILVTTRAAAQLVKNARATLE